MKLAWVVWEYLQVAHIRGGLKVSLSMAAAVLEESSKSELSKRPGASGL